MVDLSTITLASLLTIAGGFAAAPLITVLVALLKANLPTLAARVSGALQATLIAAALFSLAFVTVGTHTAEGGFQAFLAWLACVVTAVGIHGIGSHIGDVASGQAGK